MVRKRSRTGTKRKTSIRFDDSDENESETELDSDSDSALPSPAPKRYGLRQRKQAVCFEDFDYEDEEDLLTAKHRSDDEEYDIQNDLRSKENQGSRTRSRRRASCPQSSAVLVTTGTTTEVALQNGLIDFEDVIRADVVINQQKAGQKHAKAEEINKLEAESIETPTYVVEQVPKRGRGRPRKTVRKIVVPVANRPIDNKKEGGRSTASDEDSTNSTKLEVQIDPLEFVRSNLEEHNAQAQSNGVHSINVQPFAKQPNAKTVPASSVENGSLQKPTSINNIEKYVPPELDEKEKEIILSNEYLLGNSFDMSADEFLQKQAQKSTEEDVEEEDNVPLINFNDDDDSDDDVVIIEKKPEIIVLDDD